MRAIAVALVFVFHLSPNFLPGGFIGVDVFFVISGYLVSGIIIERHNTRGFYLDFIAGRLRRLVPAYIVVVLVTSILAFYLLLPNELATYGKSLIAATTFSSNMFFYLKSDYFAGSSEFYPLLHTWSLSVEWQFYFVFPFFLTLWMRLRQTLLFITMFGFFVLAGYLVLVGTQDDPSLAFYSAPFRIPEFLVGTFVRLFFNGQQKNSVTKLIWLNSVGWIPLVLIVITSLFLSKDNLFPGLYATLVAVATGSILALGNLSSYNCSWKKVLSLKPVVYLGNISYSFYLWHWPLITFYKLYLQLEFTFIDYLILTFVTLVLSHFSWKFVECRFRVNQAKNTFKVGVALVLTFLGSTIFLGVTHYTKGFSYRLNTHQLSSLNIQRWADFPGNCLATQLKDRYFHCIIGAQESVPRLLVVGDSHAQVLVWSLHNSLKERGLSAVIVAKGGCPPFLSGVPTISNIEKDICADMQRVAFDIAKNESNQFETVVLAGRWLGHEKSSFSSSRLNANLSVSGDFKFHLTQTIDFLEHLNYRVVIIDSVPEPGFPVPEWYVRAQLLGRHLNTYETSGHTISEFLYQTDSHLLRPEPLLCSNSKCEIIRKGELLYFDSNHLSIAGSDVIVQNLMEHIGLIQD